MRAFQRDKFCAVFCRPPVVKVEVRWLNGGRFPTHFKPRELLGPSNVSHDLLCLHCSSVPTQSASSRGPISSKYSIVAGAWWLLREIELSTARAKHASFSGRVLTCGPLGEELALKCGLPVR